MPRDGTGVYTYPAGTPGTPDTTIESAKYNAYINDAQNDANLARPIIAGGTGASTAADARTNLGAMPTGGGTLTGDITIDKIDPTITLDKAASGQAAWVGAQTNGTDRFWIVLSNSTAEAGANAGSDFEITRYNDAGTLLGTPLSINRATAPPPPSTVPPPLPARCQRAARQRSAAHWVSRARLRSAAHWASQARLRSAAHWVSRARQHSAARRLIPARQHSPAHWVSRARLRSTPA